MSTNPMQRIADLEASVAALTVENQSLRSNGNGQGPANVEKLIKQGFDRFGQDYTGKLAGLIQPFIENTIRRCAETEKQQTALEEKFKTHEEAVSKSADALAASFKKLQKEAEKNWNAYRAQMQEDLGHVNGFINWYRIELIKSGQQNAKAVESCQAAVKQCRDLTTTVLAPATETIGHLNEIRSQGENAIKRAAQHLSKTYENLQRPVVKLAAGFLLLVLIFMMGLGWLIVRRSENQLNTNLQQLAEYSEQQKQEIKELLDKTIEEAKESQIDREIKVKMWDAMIKTLTPQQRQAVIEQFRSQVNNAELQRIR